MATPIPVHVASAIALARHELGTTEHPHGTNNTKYGAWANNNGVAWCAIFLRYILAHTGYDIIHISKGYAYTPTLARDLVNAGWTVIPVHHATIGDFVFYDFPDSDHRIQHVGLCSHAVGGSSVITSIDGNTGSGGSNEYNGGAVMERTRNITNVAMVVRPPYTHPAPKPVWHRMLSLKMPRMRGTDVVVLRAQLKQPRSSVFDIATHRALIAYQRSHGLKVDGVFGPKTAHSMGWTIPA